MYLKKNYFKNFTFLDDSTNLLPTYMDKDSKVKPWIKNLILNFWQKIILININMKNDYLKNVEVKTKGAVFTCKNDFRKCLCDWNLKPVVYSVYTRKNYYA